MAGRTTPVSLALKAEGISEVKSALKGVKSAFVEMERDSLAATRAASKERVAILKSESKERLSLLKNESEARRSILASERSFKRTVNRKETEYGMGAAGKALMKGEGFDGVLKAAGIAGIAVAVFSSAINFASASLKQFASFVVNDVIKPGLELETRSVQVANNSGGALTAKDVQSKAKAIGLHNNMDPMHVLDAMGRFQDLTGEPALGLGIMPTVAAISKGRGYDPKALSELAAATYRPGMKEKDLNQLLMTLTGQGEKGSIPIGELARLGGRLTAPAEKLGGDWFTKVTTANALLQTAKRTGFGTVDDAAAGLEKFTQDAALHGKSLSPKSFATVDGVDTITDPIKYLGDVYRKTRGSAAALHGMGFSEPAQKFIGAYQGVFSERYAGAKAAGKNDLQARDAGATAVENFVNTMKTATSTMAAEEARRDAVTETSGEKLEAAFNRIKDRVSDVLPQIEEFADLLLENADSIGDAALTMTQALLDLAKFIKTLANPGRETRNGVRDFLGLDRRPEDQDPNDDVGPTAAAGAAADKKRRAHRHGPAEDEHKGEAGRWLRVGPEGDLTWKPDENASTSPPPAASSSSEPNSSESSEADTNAAEAAQTAADAHQELASNVDAATESVAKLTSSIDALASSMVDLNRNQSFLRR